MAIQITPANVIQGLPPLQWRNLDAPPYDVVTAEFSHEQAARRVPYVNADMHDWTGRKSFTFTARLYFINTLIGEGVLYPDAWENGWKEAILDGSADTLLHPILGPVLARVMGAKFEIRASCASGVIVDVSWAESLDDPSGPQGFIAPTVDPGTLAKTADSFASTFDVSLPDTFPDLTLIEAFNKIKGGLFSLESSTFGKLNQLTQAVEGMVDQIDALDNPSAWPARDALVQFWVALRSYEATVTAANRPTAKRVVRERTTLDAFAATVNNTLQDLMGLNLSLLRLPYIDRGTTVTHYVKA